MTEPGIEIKWISLALGIAVQCMVLGWFAATISSDVETGRRERKELRAVVDRNVVEISKIALINKDIADILMKLKKIDENTR